MASFTAQAHVAAKKDDEVASKKLARLLRHCRDDCMHKLWVRNQTTTEPTKIPSLDPLESCVSLCCADWHATSHKEKWRRNLLFQRQIWPDRPSTR
jgi:hypothetical protein